MLQIVIYKKLNFWEEYTPLNLSFKGFLASVISIRLFHCVRFSCGD